MQTAGNGVLGTISSVSGTTLTMNTPPGAALVYVGQTIQVYDTTLTTNRGSCNVVSADPISPTQTITVDSLPAGTIATDVIVHDGLSGAQPSVALRHQVSPEQRHHRHLAEPQPRHLSAAAADAARQRGELGAGTRLRAPGHQQGPQGPGHRPARQADRLHVRGAGARLGKSGHHHQPGDQGERGRAAPTISICSSPGARRCRACPSSPPSMPTRRAWIFWTCRTGDAR